MYYSSKMSVLLLVQIMSICGVSSLSLDSAVPELVYIETLHQSKYHRYLDTERDTCDSAVKVSEGLLSFFKADLETLMAGAAGHLNLMQRCLKNPGAKGCLSIFASFPTEAVESEFKTFKRCMEIASMIQKNKNETFLKASENYHKGYSTAVEKIMACERVTPETDIRKVCRKTVFSTYLTKTAPIAQQQSQSPCMETFVVNVVNCMKNSATDINTAIAGYLASATVCAQLIGEPEECLGINKGIIISLEPSLVTQIEEARREITTLNEQFDKTFGMFYKMISEVYPRVKDSPDVYFNEKMNEIVSSSLATVKGTPKVSQSPPNSICGASAELGLKDVTKQGAKEYESCKGSSEKWVGAAGTELNQFFGEFETIVKTLRTLGNVAILDCLKVGSVFGPNAVKGCFDSKVRVPSEAIKKQLENISTHKTILPCVLQTVMKIRLAADEVLLNYKKCTAPSRSLYTYRVLTPQSYYTYPWIPTFRYV